MMYDYKVSPLVLLLYIWNSCSFLYFLYVNKDPHSALCTLTPGTLPVVICLFWQVIKACWPYLIWVNFFVSVEKAVELLVQGHNLLPDMWEVCMCVCMCDWQVIGINHAVRYPLICCFCSSCVRPSPDTDHQNLSQQGHRSMSKEQSYCLSNQVWLLISNNSPRSPLIWSQEKPFSTAGILHPGDYPISSSCSLISGVWSGTYSPPPALHLCHPIPAIYSIASCDDGYLKHR